MEIFEQLFNAQLRIGDGFLLWREVIGNVFGLLSAFGGMRRKVWAWPIGIVGNLLLLTVFLGAVFGSPNPVNLLGQAGRQVMFIIVAVYGWVQWRRARTGDGANREVIKAVAASTLSPVQTGGGIRKGCGPRCAASSRWG